MTYSVNGKHGMFQGNREKQSEFLKNYKGSLEEEKIKFLEMKPQCNVPKVLNLMNKKIDKIIDNLVVEINKYEEKLVFEYYPHLIKKMQRAYLSPKSFLLENKDEIKRKYGMENLHEIAKNVRTNVSGTYYNNKNKEGKVSQISHVQDETEEILFRINNKSTSFRYFTNDVNDLVNELTLRVDKCRMQLPVCNSKIKQPQLHSDFISGYDFIGLGKLSTTCLIEHLEGIEVFCPKYKFHCRENVAVRKNKYELDEGKCSRSMSFKMKKRIYLQSSCTNSPPEFRPFPKNYLSNDRSTQTPRQQYKNYLENKKEYEQKLKVCKSRIQGTGLFARHPFRKGDLIIEYVGEVIRYTVADTRERQYQIKKRPLYFFSTFDIKNYEEGCEENKMIIDSTRYGSISRYINHSCDPNCSNEIFRWKDDETAKIVIFACKDIQEGEELTYDYSTGIGSEECECMSENCRGFF